MILNEIKYCFVCLLLFISEHCTSACETEVVSHFRLWGRKAEFIKAGCSYRVRDVRNNTALRSQMMFAFSAMSWKSMSHFLACLCRWKVEHKHTACSLANYPHFFLGNLTFSTVGPTLRWRLPELTLPPQPSAPVHLWGFVLSSLFRLLVWRNQIMLVFHLFQKFLKLVLLHSY